MAMENWFYNTIELKWNRNGRLTLLILQNPIRGENLSFFLNWGYFFLKNYS